MPVTVIVRLVTGSHRLVFDDGDVVIGRAAGANVRLLDQSVSQKHASLRVNGNECSVTDEGSRNGSFVGGVQLAPNVPRLLRSGDLLRIGRVWLEIKLDDVEPTKLDMALATRDLALAMVSQAMKLDVPSVRVVEGPDLGAVLRLAVPERAYVIGRGETCDWMLTDVGVSRVHAQLLRRGATVMLRNLGARGVLLGADTVDASSGDIIWRGQSMVRIGATVLALEEPLELAMTEISAAEDQPPDEDEAAAHVPPKGAAKAPIEQQVVSPPPFIEMPVSSSLSAPMAPIALSTSTSPEAAPDAKRRRATPSGVVFVAGTVIVVLAAAAMLVWLLRG